MFKINPSNSLTGSDFLICYSEPTLFLLKFTKNLLSV